MSLTDRNPCRHGKRGSCDRCLFPDELWNEVYPGTKTQRTPPSQALVDVASEDVWNPRPILRQLKENE